MIYLKANITNDDWAIWEARDDGMHLKESSNGKGRHNWSEHFTYSNIRSWQYTNGSTWDILTKDEVFLEMI